MKRTVFIAIEAEETKTPGLVWHARVGGEQFAQMLSLTHEHSGRVIAHFWDKGKLLECAERLSKIDWDRPIDEIVRNPTESAKSWKSVLGGISNLVRDLDGQIGS